MTNIASSDMESSDSVELPQDVYGSGWSGGMLSLGAEESIGSAGSGNATLAPLDWAARDDSVLTPSSGSPGSLSWGAKDRGYVSSQDAMEGIWRGGFASSRQSSGVWLAPPRNGSSVNGSSVNAEVGASFRHANGASSLHQSDPGRGGYFVPGSHNGRMGGHLSSVGKDFTSGSPSDAYQPMWQGHHNSYGGRHREPRGSANRRGLDNSADIAVRKIFVRNITSSVEDSEIVALFEAAAPVRSIYSACKHRGFVIVGFYDPRHATKAMDRMQSRVVRWRPLDIHLCLPKEGEMSSEGWIEIRLDVGSDSVEAQEERVRQLMKPYGDVRQVMAGSAPGQWLVECYDLRDAEDAAGQLGKSESSPVSDCWLMAATTEPPHGTLMLPRPPRRKEGESDSDATTQYLKLEEQTATSLSDVGLFSCHSGGEGFTVGSAPSGMSPSSLQMHQSFNQSSAPPVRMDERGSGFWNSHGVGARPGHSSVDNDGYYTGVIGERGFSSGSRTGRGGSGPFPSRQPMGPGSPTPSWGDGGGGSSGWERGGDERYRLIPKRVSSGGDKRTTLMIKNIPNKYTQEMLLDSFQESGHRPGPHFDFFYLPIDFKNKCNVGYAFINFTTPQHILKFFRDFSGTQWPKFNSEKVCELAYGRLQGKAKLIDHFSASNVMNEEDQCRPLCWNADGSLANILVERDRRRNRRM